jgi:diguanylate cyclase (GGDEF)-like protein/PAS domain S-box-containing protein
MLEANIRLALTEQLPALAAGEGVSELLGFSPADFLSSRVRLRDRIHADDSDIAEMLFSTDIQVPSGTFNIRLRHADGRIRCIRGNYTKGAGPDGGLVLDLNLQDAKSLSTGAAGQPVMAQFNAMMDNTDDYIYFKDRNHVFTGASQTMVFPSRPGAHWTSLIGLTDYDLLPEKYADAYYRLEKQAFTEMRMVHEIQEARTPEHERGLIDHRKYPLRDDSGKPAGLFGIARDVTERVKAERALRESEESLRESQRIAALGSYVLNIETGVWSSSDVLDEVFGIDKTYPHTVDGWTNLIHPADRETMASYFADEVLGKGKTFEKEYRILRQTGQEERWVHGLGRLEFDAQGRPVKMYGTIRDITERKLAELELLQSKELLQLFIEHAPAPLVMLDREMRFLAVNRSWQEANALVGTELLGRAYDEVLPHIPDGWRDALHRAQTGEVVRKYVERYEQPGCPLRWWQGEILPWRTGEGAVGGIVIFAEDITRQKESERQLEHIAHYDMLTGLPNRVLLADRLHQAMVQAHRRNQLLAVAYLDLDGFKAVNDRHGHDAGDDLLTVLASRMKHALREGDTLARLGGDEFVAVLLDLPDAGASVPVLTRLLDAAAEPAPLGDLMLRVSASVGVTFYPQAEEVDADQLLRQADQAMYQAKLAGRNRFQIFDSSQARSVQGRHENLEHIRQALEARQFVLHFQPMVNMRTGAVVGAEALIRWEHPARGLLPPAMFLPVIEDHPLAIELGEWVIDSALAQVETWQAAGLNLRVSVNVAAQQLQQPDFADRLAAILSHHPQVKPSSLELEILETSALGDVAQVSQMLNGCREIGVSFALDDFGTGYSSLTYLKRLPANIIKIDQSFVREMLDDAENLTILEGVLGLSVAFGRSVIAEGVETVEHGLMLLRLGCDLAQGYGIARPMPAADLPGWLAAWRPDPRWTEVAQVSFDDRPLLYAGVEHRAWVLAIEGFLKGERHVPPRLGEKQCRFGGWLEAKDRAGRGAMPESASIETAHSELHELAAAIFEHKSHGRTAEALARLGELHALQDVFLGKLKGFRQKS